MNDWWFGGLKRIEEVNLKLLERESVKHTCAAPPPLLTRREPSMKPKAKPTAPAGRSTS